MITLNNAKRNIKYKIVKIDDFVEKIRLMEMGFVSCEIKLIRANLGRKDFLVNLRNFKCILNKQLAQKIWVEKC